MREEPGMLQMERMSQSPVAGVWSLGVQRTVWLEHRTRGELCERRQPQDKSYKLSLKPG